MKVTQIRTTNNIDFKVIGNKGILNPMTTNIIQIISNKEVVYNNILEYYESKILDYDCDYQS